MKLEKLKPLHNLFCKTIFPLQSLYSNFAHRLGQREIVIQPFSVKVFANTLYSDLFLT